MKIKLEQNANRNYPVEFWRFVCIMAICIMHFNESYQIKLYSSVKQAILGGAYIGVDFFFILSGFLLNASYEKYKDRSALQYTWHKIKKIYPHYIVAFLLLFSFSNFFRGLSVTQIGNSLWNSKWEILLMQMAGFGGSTINFPTWYLSVLLIVGYFVYFILKACGRVYIEAIAPLVIFIGIAYYANVYGCMGIWSAYTGLFVLAWIRAAIELSLGVIIYEAYKVIRQFDFTQGKIAMLSVGEIVCAVIVINSFSHSGTKEDFFAIFVIAVLIVYCFINKTLVSRLLDNKISGFLGKISLTIYFNHALVASILVQYFSNLTPNLIYPLFVIITVLFSIIMRFLVDWILKLCTNKQISVTERKKMK